MKKMHLHGLRLIGVALFLWIILQIDRRQLFLYLEDANKNLIAISIFILLLTYLAKGYRWHLIVHTTDYRPSLYHSWQVYTVGVFLAAITPGKLGEFGRAAVLRKHGVSLKMGLFLVLAGRLFDIVVISLMGIWGVGLLFGWKWTLFALLIGAGMGWIILLFCMKREKIHTVNIFFQKTAFLWEPWFFTKMFLLTTAAWILYFVWGILLARSIGIDLPVLTLTAGFTITGMLAPLPIAPSSLGTRDAALIAVFAPYGVEASQSVALALLMFVTTMLLSSIGGWYWMKEQ